MATWPDREHGHPVHIVASWWHAYDANSVDLSGDDGYSADLLTSTSPHEGVYYAQRLDLSVARLTGVTARVTASCLRNLRRGHA